MFNLYFYVHRSEFDQNIYWICLYTKLKLQGKVFWVIQRLNLVIRTLKIMNITRWSTFHKWWKMWKVEQIITQDHWAYEIRKNISKAIRKLSTITFHDKLYAKILLRYVTTEQNKTENQFVRIFCPNWNGLWYKQKF